MRLAPPFSVVHRVTVMFWTTNFVTCCLSCTTPIFIFIFYRYDQTYTSSSNTRHSATAGTSAPQSVLMEFRSTSRLDLMYSTLFSDSDSTTRDRLLTPGWVPRYDMIRKNRSALFGRCMGKCGRGHPECRNKPTTGQGGSSTPTVALTHLPPSLSLLTYSNLPTPPPSLWLSLLPLIAVGTFCVRWRLDNPPSSLKITTWRQTRIVMRMFQR